MSNMLMELLPIGLFAIVIVGIKPAKTISAINDDYLTIDTFKTYKGIFAIVVVLHHLAQRTQGGGSLFRDFSHIGYLAVAAFFFYSGYGLQKSYMTKCDLYRKDFLKKRLPVVLFPYIVVTVFYWIVNWLNGEFYSFKDVMASFISGKPIVLFSWYVITIIIFYLVFWILMTVCKKNYYAMLIGGVIWYVLYTLFCIKMKYGSWWYNTPHILILGMSWAIWEEKLTKIIKRYQFIIPLVWIAFAVAFVLKVIYSSQIPTRIISLLIEIVTVILFVISLVLYSMKSKIDNKILRFLGDISFEIYLIQGLFIQLFRGNRIYIENEFVWAYLVLASSIAGGYILHIVFSKILAKYKQLVGV